MADPVETPLARRRTDLAVPPGDLRLTIEAERFAFETTAEVAPPAALVGQERAVEALELGLALRDPASNVFVAGPPGTGRMTATREIVDRLAAGAPRPPDRAYVRRFADPVRPQLLTFPAGAAAPFARALDLLVFGRAAGNHIVDGKLGGAGAQAAAGRRRRLHRWRGWRGSTPAPAASTRRTSPTTCARRCRRTPASSAPRRRWTRASARSRRSPSAPRSIHLADKSKVFNTARVEALEVDNLIEVGAGDDGLGGGAARMPRRAHRRDYERPIDDPVAPNGRNDAEWLKHTLWFSEGNRLDYKPVQPEAADRRVDPAQGAHVLTDAHARLDHAADDQDAHFQIYRYDPDKDAKPYMQTTTRSSSTAATACCSTR